MSSSELNPTSRALVTMKTQTTELLANMDNYLKTASKEDRRRTFEEFEDIYNMFREKYTTFFAGNEYEKYERYKGDGNQLIDKFRENLTVDMRAKFEKDLANKKTSVLFQPDEDDEDDAPQTTEDLNRKMEQFKRKKEKIDTFRIEAEQKKLLLNEEVRKQIEAPSGKHGYNRDNRDNSKQVSTYKPPKKVENDSDDENGDYYTQLMNGDYNAYANDILKGSKQKYNDNCSGWGD